MRHWQTVKEDPNGVGNPSEVVAYKLELITAHNEVVQQHSSA